VQAAYSAVNEKTGLPEASRLNPRMWSIAGQYSSGPLYLGAGYERHADFNPGNQAVAGAVPLSSQYVGGDDNTWTLVAGYQWGGFNIRGIYSRSEYETGGATPGAVTNLKVDGWGLFADWAIQGPHTLRATYVKVDDTSGSSATSVGSYVGAARVSCGVTSTASCASGTGADMWGFAYSYAFSKRTEGSLVYTRMKNDDKAAFSRGKTAASLGNSQTSTGVVLRHRF